MPSAPAPPGFYAVVCTPAPIVDPRGGSDLVELLREVVRHSRGGVLVTSDAAGPPGAVMVVGRLPDGRTRGPARWFRPIRRTADAELLADWLAIGGPLAPLPPGLRELEAGAHARAG